MGDPDSSTSDGDDCFRLERLSMALNDLGHQPDALRCRDIRKAYQAGVPEALQVHEFSEIGVDCDENPALDVAALKQRLIARVRAELAGLQDVMTLAPQPIRQLRAGAAIHEELHGFATDTADSVSRAITAWA